MTPPAEVIGVILAAGKGTRIQPERVHPQADLARLQPSAA